MILLVSAVFPPEPVVSATLAKDLADALSEITEVKVLSPKPTRPLGFSFIEKDDNKSKYEHIILKSYTYPESGITGRMLESFSFGKHASDFIKMNRVDIQCIYLNAWPLLAQFMLVKIAKRFSIPIIIHVQDIYPESLSEKLPLILKGIFTKCFLLIDKYIQKNADKVVTISPKMRTFLINSRQLAEEKVKVVYNWQDEEKFIAYKNSRQNNFQKSYFTFMFLGNINKTAALDVLISAFAACGLENARLIIAGSGSEKDSLKSLAKKYPSAKIEFWEADVSKVPEIQDKAEVMILSLKRGVARFALPSKLPAYMFSSKPIIASVDEDCDTANAIRQAKCGWVIPPENLSALTDAMITAFSMPDFKLRNYGEKGFTFALGNYTRKINLQKLAAIILSNLKDGK